MEIREFAERVLLGQSLADKLVAPRELTDLAPGPAIAAPAVPGRPLELPLRSGANERERFPTRRDLEREAGRGIALHFFANHELLALEAMALALLRFPDAPPAFRRELTVTMSEEQQHFSLYVDRMTACGVELGTVPVNAFFWQATRDAPTLLDFIVRMSLCFEQANLDYARHYMKAFAEVGDDATATVLERVYREEIAHVRRGLAWFRRELEPGADEFDAFARHLTLPLSPARARGRDFCAESRRRAGFDEAFIARMATVGGSKGRSPSAHFFTPTSELCVGAGRDYNPPARFDTLRRDLQTVPMFLAANDDIVVVDEAPDIAWLDELRRAGVTLPEFVAWTDGPPAIEHPRLTDLCAWGFAPQTQRWLRPWFPKLRGQQLHKRATLEHDAPAWYTGPWTEHTSRLYSKATSCEVLRGFLAKHDASWLCDEHHVGRVATTVDEVMDALEALVGTGSTTNVIKAEYGVSGRNMRRISGPTLSADDQAWLANQLHRDRRVVVEPWLDGVYDLSLRMRIVEPGRASVQGIGQFLTDARGQYKGAILGPATANFDEAARRFASGDGREPKRLSTMLHALAGHIAAALQPWHYTGLVGVDALVFRDQSRLRLKPIVEINARPNMGHVAHGLSRLLHGRSVGLWLIVPLAELARAGFDNAVAWAETMRQRAPLRMTGEGSSRRIVSGALLTTDPARARQFVSVAVVADSLTACSEMLAPLRSPLSRHSNATP